jgi:hypothetical protein
MAAKTLAYTQCQTSDVNSAESEIQIIDQTNNILSQSTFTV